MNRTKSVSWRSFSRGLLVVFAAVTLLVWVGCRSEEPTPPTPSSPETAAEGTIVAFGDSLTEGYGLAPEDAYPARLERMLKDLGHRYRVINAGVSGETSSGALSRTDWILRLSPDIVILETGANDGLRGTDPDLTRSNIDRIVEKLTARGVVVILAGMKITQNLGRSYANQFMAIYPHVAQKRNLILIPFFLEGVAADPNLNLSDGIHPNAAGYEIIARNVLPYVLQAVDTR